MSVTLEDLVQYTDKEALVHLVQEDGSVKEVVATIKMATEAGVALKVKGKSSLDFIDSIDKIEEVGPAPVKAKGVTQKKLKPIELGQARQHLLDRHGVELKWAKEADEQAAFEYHQGLDHSTLGHVHVEKDEREQALAES